MSNFQPTSPESRKADPLMVGLILTILLLLGGSIYLALGHSKHLALARQYKSDVASLEQALEVAKLQAERDLENSAAAHQVELQRVNAEWASQLDSREAQHEQRLQQSMADMANIVNEVVNESGRTLGYMEQLESKIRAGQQLQQVEVDKLRSVAGGLAYLHKQYEKPIHEFRELESYLAKQLDVPASVEPEEKGRLLRRLFSRDYRENQRDQFADYYQDQGRREVLVAARKQVAASYGKAQKEMASMRVNHEAYIASLDSIIESKAADTKALDSFFEVSGRILNIHQRMLETKPPEPPVPADQSITLKP